jgi:hypothetical protein
MWDTHPLVAGSRAAGGGGATFSKFMGGPKAHERLFRKVANFSSFRVSQRLMNYCLGTQLEAMLLLCRLDRQDNIFLLRYVSPSRSLGQICVPKQELGNQS